MNKPTIVTCYYKISSKRPHEHYVKYIDYFLGNLNPNINLVLFTSSDMVGFFNKYTSVKPNIRVVVKEFEQIPLYIKYKDIWEKQYMLDNQKNTGRTWKCYVIWNSKINFVTEAIELNLFKNNSIESSNKYVWVDIGCVRDIHHASLVKNFPNVLKISENKLDIILLDGEFKNPNQKFFRDEIHFAGAIFGGSAGVFKRLSELYYKKFSEYLENNQFIGCDQQIISSVYLENKDLFNAIITPLRKINKIDPWFYLLVYYL